MFAFIFSNGPLRAHTYIVDPSEVVAAVFRLIQEGHTNIRVGDSEETAVPYDVWLGQNGAPE